MTRYEKLKELNLYDAYLIISDVNRFYITGFKSSFGYAIYAGGKSYYLTDFRYREEAEAYFKGQGIEVAAGAAKEIDGILKSILSSSGIKSVGFEDNRISFNEYNSLKELLNTELVPMGNKLDNLRSIKDEYEIKQIAAAQKITDKAFKEILKFIKPGITEKDICTELEYRMARLFADCPAFDTIIASGRNSSRPHSHVTKRKIQNGDFVILDFGAKYNGYCSDMTRTVAVGNASEEMQKVYGIVLGAQRAALEKIESGAKCSDAFNIADGYFLHKGYKKEFLHGLGHGVGIEIHEPPSLNLVTETKLKPGMTVTVEPGLYLNNKFGVRIEDLIIIEKDGIRNLTVSDKELIIL